jgi:hypothetical protein
MNFLTLDLFPFYAGESGFPSECDVCGWDPGGEGHGQQYCRLPHEQSTHRASHRYLKLGANTANEFHPNLPQCEKDFSVMDLQFKNLHSFICIDPFCNF